MLNLYEHNSLFFFYIEQLHQLRVLEYRVWLRLDFANLLLLSLQCHVIINLVLDRGRGRISLNNTKPKTGETAPAGGYVSKAVTRGAYLIVSVTDVAYFSGYLNLTSKYIKSDMIYYKTIYLDIYKRIGDRYEVSGV